MDKGTKRNRFGLVSISFSVLTANRRQLIAARRSTDGAIDLVKVERERLSPREILGLIQQAVLAVIHSLIPQRHQ